MEKNYKEYLKELGLTDELIDKVVMIEDFTQELPDLSTAHLHITDYPVVERLYSILEDKHLEEISFHLGISNPDDYMDFLNIKFSKNASIEEVYELLKDKLQE